MAKKDDLIKKYQVHKSDTGSAQVQIILLTFQMAELASHLKDHHKDFDSKRGLLKMVNKRRKLLSYLENQDPEKYKKLATDLKLKQKTTAKSIAKKTVRQPVKKAIAKKRKSTKKTKKKKPLNSVRGKQKKTANAKAGSKKTSKTK